MINDFYYELKNKLASLNSGEVLTLEKNKTYHVFEEDTFKVKNIYLSNTCSLDEKPNGLINAGIYIKDKHDVVIDGNGAKLILHGHITPFLFSNINGLVIKNLTIDYKYPTMSEFQIINKINDKYTIRVQKDTLYTVKNNDLIFHSERNKTGGYYWSYGYRDYLNIAMFKDPYNIYTRTQAKDAKCKFPCIPEFKTIKQINNRDLEVELVNKDDYFKVGDYCEVRDTKRDQIGGAFLFCKDVRMENMKIYAMHGFGILSEMCENVYIYNNKIVPKSGRNIASNADFLHFSCCRGIVQIINNKLAEGHDDFVNIHGIPLEIVEVKNDSAIVHFKNDYSFGFDCFKNGDKVEIVDPKNLQRKGLLTIKKHKLLGLKDIELNFIENIGNLRTGFYINNLENNPEIIIKNNKFGPSMGRGILVTSNKKTVIENNFFYKLGGSVLYIADDCNFWYESGAVNNVIFKNNKIHDCAYNPFGTTPVDIISTDPIVKECDNSSLFVHNKVVIKNNYFTSIRNDKYFLSSNYTKTFELLGNYFDKDFFVNSKNSNVLTKDNFREKNIILFGDSIAFGDQVKFNYSWARMLLNNKKIGVVNHAVRGFSTINYEKNFEDLLKSSLNKNSKNIVLIALGINDSVLIKNKEYVSLEKYEQLLTKFVNFAKKYVDDIVLIGLTSCDEKRTCPISWSEVDTRYKNDRIIKYDNLLMDIARKKCVGYIRLMDIIKPELTVDGLHPNYKCHKKLYDIISEYIEVNF